MSTNKPILLLFLHKITECYHGPIYVCFKSKTHFIKLIVKNCPPIVISYWPNECLNSAGYLQTRKYCSYFYIKPKYTLSFGKVMQSKQKVFMTGESETPIRESSTSLWPTSKLKCFSSPSSYYVMRLSCLLCRETHAFWNRS